MQVPWVSFRLRFPKLRKCNFMDVHWYGLDGSDVWDHALRRCRLHHIRDLLVVLDCWNQKPLIESQVVSNCAHAGAKCDSDS